MTGTHTFNTFLCSIYSRSPVFKYCMAKSILVQVMLTTMTEMLLCMGYNSGVGEKRAASSVMLSFTYNPPHIFSWIQSSSGGELCDQGVH